MKDSLYKELLETNAQPSNLHPAFLAQKDEISFALSKGYSRKAIWENLRSTKKFGGCYITFCSYVTRYITQKPTIEITQVQPKKMQTQSQVSPTKPQSKPKMVNTPENPQPAEPKNKFNWSPNYDAKALTG